MDLGRACNYIFKYLNLLLDLVIRNHLTKSVIKRNHYMDNRVNTNKKARRIRHSPMAELPTGHYKKIKRFPYAKSNTESFSDYLLLIALILISTASISQASENNTVLSRVADRPLSQSNNLSSTNIEMIVKASVAENSVTMAKKIYELENKLNEQRYILNALEKQISETQKPPDTNTTTLVLACVSVLITVLGVVVAILSIFGYTNIKDEAAKNARIAAQDTVEKITKAELPAQTEKNIIQLIENNRFDNIIQNAVENIVYRGISLPEETTDGEEGT